MLHFQSFLWLGLLSLVALLEIHIAYREIRIRVLARFQRVQEPLPHLPVWNNVHICVLSFVPSPFPSPSASSPPSLSPYFPSLPLSLSLIILVQWVTLNNPSEDHGQIERILTNFLYPSDAYAWSYGFVLDSLLFPCRWKEVLKTSDGFFICEDMVIFFYFFLSAKDATSFINADVIFFG